MTSHRSCDIAMRERPILFSGEMVRAILNGTKTQTRRVLRHKYPEHLADLTIQQQGKAWYVDKGAWDDGYLIQCPYGVRGDRLWVRETWCHKSDDGFMVYNADGDFDTSCAHYAADGEDVHCMDEDGGTAFNSDGSLKSPWKPSIHMPRWASRITLEITGVRVERVQDISFDDALAEGIIGTDHWHKPHESLTADLVAAANRIDDPDKYIDEGWRLTAVAAYRALWDSINSERGFGWEKNPWVWVIEFKRGEK